jgi:hypothetical protein
MGGKLREGRALTEITDPVHFRRRLRLDGERRREDAEGEDEAKGAEPHGGVLHNTRALTVGEQRGSPPH